MTELNDFDYNVHYTTNVGNNLNIAHGSELRTVISKSIDMDIFKFDNAYYDDSIKQTKLNNAVISALTDCICGQLAYTPTYADANVIHTFNSASWGTAEYHHIHPFRFDRIARYPHLEMTSERYEYLAQLACRHDHNVITRTSTGIMFAVGKNQEITLDYVTVQHVRIALWSPSACDVNDVLGEESGEEIYALSAYDDYANNAAIAHNREYVEGVIRRLQDND